MKNIRKEAKTKKAYKLSNNEGGGIVAEHVLTHDEGKPSGELDLNARQLVLLDDAVAALSRLPDDSVDLVFADPPYNLSNDGFTCHSGRAVSVNKGGWDRSRGFAEDVSFHRQWIAVCQRVLKPEGTIWISGTYHSIYQCGYILQELDFRILNDICWFKRNAAPNLSCRMFAASHETLLWARKASKAKHCYNYDIMRNDDARGDILKNPGKQMRSVWSIPTTPRSEKVFGKHPTQKPEKLLERIVLACSKRGDLVLDPFMGSGTTGVVAMRMGRRFIGIDFDSEYYDIALRRISSVMDQKISGSNERLDIVTSFYGGNINEPWEGTRMLRCVPGKPQTA